MVYTLLHPSSLPILPPPPPLISLSVPFSAVDSYELAILWLRNQLTFLEVAPSSSRGWPVRLAWLAVSLVPTPMHLLLLLVLLLLVLLAVHQQAMQ